MKQLDEGGQCGPCAGWCQAMCAGTVALVGAFVFWVSGYALADGLKPASASTGNLISAVSAVHQISAGVGLCALVWLIAAIGVVWRAPR